MKNSARKDMINLSRLVDGEDEANRLEELNNNYNAAKTAAKKSCLASLLTIGQTAFTAWMVMFAVALLGFPVAYLTCLLATYAVVCIIAVGVNAAVQAVTNATKSIKQ